MNYANQCKFKPKHSLWALDKLPTWPRCHTAGTASPPSGEALDGCPIYVHICTHKGLHISIRETKEHLNNNSKNDFCVSPSQGRPLSFRVLHKMETAWVDGEIQSRKEGKIHHG